MTLTETGSRTEPESGDGKGLVTENRIWSDSESTTDTRIGNRTGTVTESRRKLATENEQG